MESTARRSLRFLLQLHLLFSFLHRILSTSPPLFPSEAIPTRSGYLPVNPATGSAIFYTFYEAQEPSPLSETPLLIWLQGGPGCSSMIGNFLELGPWRVHSHTHNKTEQLYLEPNPSPWNRLFGLLFLDSPIGTGFSLAATTEEIPRNQTAVAQHLYAAITRFIELDPVFKNRPIYITGESYAGKYIPALGYYILKKNGLVSPDKVAVNLKGVAIGNGLTDPETQVATHGVNAYFSGFINERQKEELERAQDESVRLVRVGNWSGATKARNRVLDLLQNMTGLATLYDFSKKTPYRTDLVTALLGYSEVKKALKANEAIAFGECSDAVGAALHEDVMKSVKFMVEYLVKNTRVLLYQGHYDLRDGVVSTEAWVRTMKWEGINEFLNAERKFLKVNGEVAGYVQSWINLSHVIVLRAGHLVPTDQPLTSQTMIENWVLETDLFAIQGSSSV